MRQAVAPSESVENNSFEVTNLFKICSHCQRLRKKVRERRKGKQTHFPDRTGLKKAAKGQRCRVRVRGVTKPMLCCDVFFSLFLLLFLESKQAAVQRVLCAKLVYDPVQLAAPYCVPSVLSRCLSMSEHLRER